MPTGIVTMPTADPQNPFDTAWALRHNTSTNPFLANNSVAGSTAAQPPVTQHQFSKEFEIKM